MNRLAIKLIGIIVINLLLNSITTKISAHSPEYHLREETLSEPNETEGNQNNDNDFQLSPEQNHGESEINDSINSISENQPYKLSSETLAIFILINPFLLCFFRNQLLLKNRSSSH